MKFFPKNKRQVLINETISNLFFMGWTMDGAINRLREESRIDPKQHGFDHKELDAFIEESQQNNLNLNK